MSALFVVLAQGGGINPPGGGGGPSPVILPIVFPFPLEAIWMAIRGNIVLFFACVVYLEFTFGIIRKLVHRSRYYFFGGRDKDGNTRAYYTEWRKKLSGGKKPSLRFRFKYRRMFRPNFDALLQEGSRGRRRGLHARYGYGGRRRGRGY